jgi:hypothetical protein
MEVECLYGEHFQIRSKGEFMSDIKSISHQSIHSTQSSSAEPSQKTSEILKEKQPSEAPAPSKEKQAEIKHAKQTEAMLFEAAIKAKTGGPTPPSPLNPRETEPEIEAPEKLKKGISVAAEKAAKEAVRPRALGEYIQRDMAWDKFYWEAPIDSTPAEDNMGVKPGSDRQSGKLTDTVDELKKEPGLKW